MRIEVEQHPDLNCLYRIRYGPIGSDISGTFLRNVLNITSPGTYEIQPAVKMEGADLRQRILALIDYCKDDHHNLTRYIDRLERILNVPAQVKDDHHNLGQYIDRLERILEVNDED